MKALKITLVIVYIIVLIVVYNIMNFAGNRAVEVVEKSTTSDKIIYNYDNFYNLYEGLNGVKKNIEAIDKEVKSIEESYVGKSKNEWIKSDLERYNFIKDTRNGYIQLYNRNASDYNSNAQKLTSKYFKDWKLPDRIELIY